MTDNDREARLDQMVAETEGLVEQVYDVVGNLKEALESIGCQDTGTLQKLLQSDRCSQEVRERASEDFEKLQRDLEEEEERLLAESGYPDSDSKGKRSRRGIVNKI